MWGRHSSETTHNRWNRSKLVDAIAILRSQGTHVTVPNAVLTTSCPLFPVEEQFMNRSHAVNLYSVSTKNLVFAKCFHHDHLRALTESMSGASKRSMPTVKGLQGWRYRAWKPSMCN